MLGKEWRPDVDIFPVRNADRARDVGNDWPKQVFQMSGRVGVDACEHETLVRILVWYSGGPRAVVGCSCAELHLQQTSADRGRATASRSCVAGNNNNNNVCGEIVV